jgi:hypothetical protein
MHYVIIRILHYVMQYFLRGFWQTQNNLEINFGTAALARYNN